MTIALDFFAFLVCAGIWLGPMIINIGRGRWWLLHPFGIFPIMIVYMLLPPLVYRMTGDTIRITGGTWANDPWFLAAPMLLLGLAGIFYHLGVKLTGNRMNMGKKDDLKNCLPFKTLHGVRGQTLFLVTVGIFALGVALQLAMPAGMRESSGFYWMHIFFRSFFILPLLVFQQNRKLGLFTLLIFLPATFLLRSKAMFLYIVMAFGIFYQEKIFRLSKAISTLLILLLFLTPLAVALYTVDFAQSFDMQALEDLDTPTYEQSLDKIVHREYAFETFACVYQSRAREGEPLHLGAKNLTDILENIPKVLYPQKPMAIDNQFPKEYLRLDYKGYDIHYARYFLSSFFLDFGIPGVCLGGLVVGILWGFCYRRAINATYRKKELWPLMLYMCLAINAKWLVDANIPSTLANCIGQLLAVWLVIVIARRLRHPAPHRRYAYLPGQRPENRKFSL